MTMMNYDDLYDLLNSVERPVKYDFFTHVQDSVLARIKNKNCGPIEKESLIDDLLQFSKDIQCTHLCLFNDHNND